MGVIYTPSGINYQRFKTKLTILTMIVICDYCKFIVKAKGHQLWFLKISLVYCLSILQLTTCQGVIYTPSGVIYHIYSKGIT
jgi:hypothetical protein